MLMFYIGNFVNAISECSGYRLSTKEFVGFTRLKGFAAYFEMKVICFFFQTLVNLGLIRNFGFFVKNQSLAKS